MSGAPTLYAIVAEFGEPEKLVEAVHRCRARYANINAYAPYAVDGLAEAVGFRRNRVALCALLGGVAGAIGIYALMWYSAVVDYPINSGGRPLDAWQVFIIPTFEVTVLGAALAAFIGMLVLNGLPRLNHPIFNAPDFDLASRNRFFLSVRASDARFDPEGARAFLAQLAPIRVFEVPA
jgi:hypothetical protein